MQHYYNEFDPKAAAWLRELMADGLIPKGHVDERDIRRVTGADLRGYGAVHLFAGIGGWAHALKLAEWPESLPVWTGSCPCQPYSAAGKHLGDADSRNLWPEMYRLLRECKPIVCFGEQVEGAIKHGWLDRVSADMEAEGYSVGAAVLGAHSVGAPHIRQRLYWVAHAEHRRPREQEQGPESRGDGSSGSGLAYSNGRESGNGDVQRSGEHGQRAEDSSASGVQHATSDGRRERRAEPERRGVECGRGDFWSDAKPFQCTDGKARRVEPGIFPLAHGIPGRVALLRGAGNAICPQTAAEFIRAYREVIGV